MSVEHEQVSGGSSVDVENDQKNNDTVRDPFIRLSTRNEHSNTNESRKKENRDDKNVYMQKCVKACEGMSEDMPVTYLPTSEKR